MKFIIFILVLSTSIICYSQSDNSKPKVNSKKIDSFLSQLVKHNFNGGVLVSDGKNVFKKCFGFADKENNIKCDSETVFDIGSITKQFTAAGILKLEMMKKLSVNDSITKYFDNLPDDKKEITIHQLLAHSAGFPGGIGDDYEAIKRDEYLNKAFQTKLKFKPGTRYAYSNVGYSILAAIIEKTSRKSYEEFLNKHLFSPAKMKKTGYTIPKWTKEELAVGYSENKRWGKPTEKRWDKNAPYWNLLGNGGILSNLSDMYKWHKALLGEQILSKEAKKKFYTRHIKEGENASSYYGYGWALFPTSRDTWLIAHNGGNGIFFADFWRFTEENVTIILMTNSIKEEFERIPFEITKSVFRSNYTPSIKIASSNTIKSLDKHPNGKLIKNFFETVRSQNKENISNFVKQNFSEDMINIAPMKEHIKILSELGTKLKNSKIESISLQGNKTILKVQGFEDNLTIMIEDKKIAGIRF